MPHLNCLYFLYFADYCFVVNSIAQLHAPAKKIILSARSDDELNAWIDVLVTKGRAKEINGKISLFKKKIESVKSRLKI